MSDSKVQLRLCISNEFPSDVDDAAEGPHLRASGLDKRYSNRDVSTFRETQWVFWWQSRAGSFNEDNFHLSSHRGSTFLPPSFCFPSILQKKNNAFHQEKFKELYYPLLLTFLCELSILVLIYLNILEIILRLNSVLLYFFLFMGP